jgi:hypothetical protein
VAHECPRDGTPAFGCSSCYGHLKAKAMRGGTLSPDELEFVGVVDPRGGSRAHPGGWRQPNTAAFELDSILSAEDTALLQSLMNAGSTDRVEFLGG